MSKKNILWLYGELPKLVAKGVFSADTSNKIQDYYGNIEKKDFGQLILTIFATIGAVLIGLGIILLFAFNWDKLERSIKVLLAFLPLVISQIIVLFVLLKKKESPVWRESSSVFLTATVGASIALISQIYNIPGNFGDFLLAWILLIVPLTYLLDSNIVSLLYLIGITSWSGYAQAEGEQSLLFWFLLAILIPKLIIKYRENKYSNISVYLSWTLAICLTISIGITLEKVLPGLWIIIYSSFFTVLYITGFLWFNEAPSIIQKPFHTIGSLGIIILGFILTYNWPWRGIGWHNIRYDERFDHYAAVGDYIITIGIILLLLFLIIYSFKKKELNVLFFGIFPFIVLIGYLLVSSYFDKDYKLNSSEEEVSIIIHLLLNAYLLFIGIFTIIFGTKNRKILLTNGGTLIISVLICLRFVFVEEFFENLKFRGIIFVLIGVCFIVANVFIAKRIKRSEK